MTPNTRFHIRMTCTSSMSGLIYKRRKNVSLCEIGYMIREMATELEKTYPVYKIQLIEVMPYPKEDYYEKSTK